MDFAAGDYMSDTQNPIPPTYTLETGGGGGGVF